jgi:hypothetical protein
VQDGTPYPHPNIDQLFLLDLKRARISIDECNCLDFALCVLL